MTFVRSIRGFFLETVMIQPFLIIAFLLCAMWVVIAARSESPEEQLQDLFFPQKRQSYQNAPETYELNGVRFAIPRNLVAHIFKNEQGLSTVELHAELPRLSGLTPDSRSCLLDVLRCPSGIRIGINRSPHVPDRILFNQMLQGTADNTKRPGPYGLDLYLDRRDDGGAMYAQRFVHEYTYDDILILRCDKIHPPA